MDCTSSEALVEDMDAIMPIQIEAAVQNNASNSKKKYPETNKPTMAAHNSDNTKTTLLRRSKTDTENKSEEFKHIFKTYFTFYNTKNSNQQLSNSGKNLEIEYLQSHEVQKPPEAARVADKSIAEVLVENIDPYELSITLPDATATTTPASGDSLVSVPKPVRSTKLHHKPAIHRDRHKASVGRDKSPPGSDPDERDISEVGLDKHIQSATGFGHSRKCSDHPHQNNCHRHNKPQSQHNHNPNMTVEGGCKCTAGHSTCRATQQQQQQQPVAAAVATMQKCKHNRGPTLPTVDNMQGAWQTKAVVFNDKSKHIRSPKQASSGFRSLETTGCSVVRPTAPGMDWARFCDKLNKACTFNKNLGDIGKNYQQQLPAASTSNNSNHRNATFGKYLLTVRGTGQAPSNRIPAYNNCNNSSRVQEDWLDRCVLSNRVHLKNGGTNNNNQHRHKTSEKMAKSNIDLQRHRLEQQRCSITGERPSSSRTRTPVCSEYQRSWSGSYSKPLDRQMWEKYRHQNWPKRTQQQNCQKSLQQPHQQHQQQQQHQQHQQQQQQQQPCCVGQLNSSQNCCESGSSCTEESCCCCDCCDQDVIQQQQQQQQSCCCMMCQPVCCCGCTDSRYDDQGDMSGASYSQYGNQRPDESPGDMSGTCYCDSSEMSGEPDCGCPCPCRCPQFIRPPPYCMNSTYRMNYFQKCIPKFRRYQECDNLRLPLC